jgi:hypothetical protein
MTNSGNCSATVSLDRGCSAKRPRRRSSRSTRQRSCSNTLSQSGEPSTLPAVLAGEYRRRRENIRRDSPKNSRTGIRSRKEYAMDQVSVPYRGYDFGMDVKSASASPVAWT